jgi:hypothetical protein
MTPEEQQIKLNENLKALSEAPDFKEYFKIQREIVSNYVGTWEYVERFLEPDPVLALKMLVESFGKKAKLDASQGKVEKEKMEVIEKFSKEMTGLFEKRDFSAVTQKLFYVLLGNVLEHIGESETDMNKFSVEKDLYPKLKMPLGLVVFLFQNLAFGPVVEKIKDLSPEYLKKYCALLLGLWRTAFDVMAYEKHEKEHGKEHEHNHEHEQENREMKNNGEVKE